MAMIESTPSRRGAGLEEAERIRTGCHERRVMKGPKQKERNHRTHALKGNATTNLERAQAVATKLNATKAPHPHQAAVALGAEEPNRNVLPPEEWVTKILPMVVIAER